MTYKVLMGCDFTALVNESSAQTATGVDLINKYKMHLMTNPESCELINNFIREASVVRYDSGVVDTLETITEYINNNKTSWALASVCERINKNSSDRNYLNRNAARQAEKLLENEEKDVVKYIRAGALKNVMFCEGIRNVAKSVFTDVPMVVQTAEYTKTTPVSLVEQYNNCHYFVVEGKLYKIDGSKNVQEGEWKDVSNNFKTIESLLESHICSVDADNIYVQYNNKKYTINEANSVSIDDRTMTVEQFRDNSHLVLATTNPRRKHEVAGVLEAIALCSENYDQIVLLDTVNIFSTAKDRFVVIESGSNLYATLLGSNHSTSWTINEDAVKACNFIFSKTGVALAETYSGAVEEAIEEADEQHGEEMRAQLESNQILSIKERIELLTEKFKHDPTKLAVLSKLASEAAEL